MKKTAFQQTVRSLVNEFYSTSRRPLKEYDPQVPESPENQENPEYYDQPRPENQMYSKNSGLGKFTDIDWIVVHEIFVHNTNIIDKNPNLMNSGHSGVAYNISDFIQDGVMSKEELDVLEDANIIDYAGGIPILTNVEYKEYQIFKAAALKVWETPQTPRWGSTRNDSEEPYLRGYEPMSEGLKKVYRNFKDNINENVSEIDFATKIRGVVYEYSHGVPSTTPEAAIPTRAASGDTSNIARDPDGAAKQGEKMEKTGQIIKTAAAQIKSTNQTLQEKNNIKEYVVKHMLPSVMEIMKQAENPRATKRELLEFFKLVPKK